MSPSTRTKILILLKNLDSNFSRLLNYLRFPRLPSNRSAKEILFVRPGGLGDLVLLTYSLRAFTDDLSLFTFIIEKRSEEWAKILNLRYLCYDKDLIRIMLTKRFHHVICTEQLFGLAGHLSNFLTSKNGRLIGFDTCKSSDLFTTKVEFVEDLHETENFNNLVKVVMNKETKLKSATRTTMSRTPSYEVIILGGSDSESRSLTIEDWIYLVKQYGGQFSLFKIVAAPQDQELAKSLASRINADEISNSFESAISLVSGSKSVLTVDSGFVHIASYFGVPAKVLFTSGNPKKWSPLSSGSIVLQNGFSCQPCGKFGQVPPCNFSFRCKSNLSSLELTKVIH